MEMDFRPTEATSVYIPPPPEVIPFDTNYREDHFTQRTPIIIDNGATHFRYAFSTSEDPYTGLNIASKFRERKTNRPLLLFGGAIETDSAARGQAKAPWEGDLLCNFDALESALDYAFLRMGIDSERVDHPILMTERLYTPLHSRNLTSELLFECYSAPSAAYCIDSLLSFSHNFPRTSPLTTDGLVVSFNTASTSIIPILGGNSLLMNAKRMPWGGTQAADYLLKLVQLKYPSFPTRVTTAQSNWMLQSFCEVSEDYQDTLKQLRDPANLRAAEKIVQFPYTVTLEQEKTEEELARAAEKRREAGRRLQEQAAKARSEKLLQKESDLQYLIDIKDWKEKEKKSEYNARLRGEGFESEQALDEATKKLEADLKKARRKYDGLEDEPGEEPTFPLLDVPDDELDEDSIKEKKKQRLLKAGYDARMRARKEKEEERKAKEEDEKREKEERENDPKAWSEKLRKEHDAIMERLTERKKRKAALQDRKSAAAQARMKSITSLANDQPSGRKKRKGGNDDMFGADDADWAIYRKINNGNASSSEDEDQINLASVEARLLTHDPTFALHQTFASLTAKKSALMTSFRPSYEDGDVEGAHRLHLNVERWRVPESWFDPSQAGADCAGLGEVIEGVLRGFSASDRDRLVKNVFLTGGPSLMPGLPSRLLSTIRPILPPGTQISVNTAADARLDAWHGMASFSRTEEFAEISITKAEYEEFGGERIKRWWGGNAR